MSIENILIPSLTNGVSQQAASVRSVTQLAEQDNAWPSLVEGLTKRPPMEHVAKLRATTVADACVHEINRDTTERYVVLFLNGDLEVYDLIAGTSVTLTAPDGKTYLNCTTPSEQLAAVTIADYTFVINKTVVVTLAAASGGVLAGTVQAFSNLPATPALNDIYKITGNATNPFDNYYVTWNGTVWVETVAPGLQNSYTASTMPHILVRNADGTFTFKRATWNARITADQFNAPMGTFVGRTISEVVFHRNRLGIVSDEGIVFSRAASFFNLFRTTATQVLDTDPVHTAISHSKVSIIRHAIAFDKQTLLFADQTQFALTAVGSLTASTASIDVTTEFEASKLARPVAAGTSLYFSAERGLGACIREYFVQEDTLQNDAADITAHCPTYIPNNVFKLTANTSQDCLTVLNKTQRNVVHVYKFYWRDNEKLQSAWGKWTLASTDTVLSAASIGSIIYFVIQRSDGIFLEKCNVQQALTDSDMGLRVHLDRRVYLTGVYNSGTDVTTWTLPYAESAALQVVLGGDFPTTKGSLVTHTRPTTTTIAAVGDYSAGRAYVGRKYTMRTRLSEPFMRDKDGAPILHGRLQLKRLIVRYTNSGSFKVEVTPQARNKSTYPWNGKRLGDSTFIIGTPSVASGSFQAPILSRADRVTVELVNDSFLPSAFQSAEWIAEFTPKSKRA